VSPPKAGSTTSRLSRTISAILQITDDGNVASSVDDELYRPDNTPSRDQKENLEAEEKEDDSAAANEQLRREG